MGFPLWVNMSERQWAHVFSQRGAEFSQRLRIVHPAQRQSLSMSTFEPENIVTQQLNANRACALDPVSVLVLDDVILHDWGKSVSLPFMSDYQALSQEVEEEISVPCNSGLTPFSEYGHFLHDQVSRTAIYALDGASSAQPLLLNHLHDGLIAAAERYWPGRCWFLRNKCVRVKRLHLMVHQHWRCANVQARWLREQLFRHGSRRPDRRLYLSRTARRTVVNEQEVIELLSRHGFVVVADSELRQMPLHEQAHLFHSTKILVSPHGSALVSGFFLPRRAVVVEWFKFCFIECTPASAMRAANQDVQYHYGVDWDMWEGITETRMHSSMKIDVRKLAKLLQRWL
jgi:hypothetical protein